MTLGSTLERIILNNFNSFKVDEVPFHKGFTVITGPNGAGKSTIFQGIRFSLGSNEKDGRATVWSDFIRIGQEAGYAEIHLRNKKKLIKIRRIIIKGKTPFYKIQEETDGKFKKCSVSKIQSLLWELGINPDNVFAFVSQGNITSIKNMEKKQICDYLERGLGLYPLREEIISNKKTIEDLDAQIKSLTQMEKVATYELSILEPQIIRLDEKKKLEEVKIHLEKEQIWLNRAKIQQEIKQIQVEIKGLEQKIESLDFQKNEVSGTINHLEASIKEKTAQITMLSQHILDEKVREKNLEVEISRWQSDKDNLGDKILHEKSKMKILKAECQRFTEEQKICLSETQKHKFDLSVLQQQRKSLFDEFESHQKTKKKFQDIMQEYEMLRTKKKDVDLNLKDTVLQMEAIDRDISGCMNDIRYLRQELEKDKWFLNDPEKNSLEALTQSKKKINIALEKLARNSSQLEKETQELDKQLEQLKNSVLMKELPKSQNIINLMKEIQNRNLDVIGPIIDYIDFNPEIALAIDSILSNYVLNSFIAKNKQDFLLIHDLIKRTGAKCNVYQPFTKEIRSYKPIESEEGVFGYLSDFITPISQNDSIKKVLISICRNTVLIKDRSIGYDYINKHNHKGKVVALDGTVIRSYEYVLESRASETRKTYSNPIEQKREVKKLEAQLLENRTKLDEYRNQTDKLQRALNLSDDRLQRINAITFNYTKLTITINKKDSLLKNKGTLSTKKNTFQTELNSLQNEINQIQKNLPENFETMDKFIDEFQEKITNLDAKIESMNKLLTNKIKEESFLLVKIEQYTSDLETHTRILDTYENELKSGNVRILQSINELAVLRDRIEYIIKEQNTLNENILKIQEETKTERDSMNSIIQSIERLKIKIEFANAQIYEKQKMVETITIEITELGENYKERSIEEVMNDLRVVYEKLREYYDVTEQILERKQELEEQLARSSQKQSELEKEIHEAKLTVDALEKQYFSSFSEHLQKIEHNIDARFQKIGIHRKGLFSLVGNFEELGVDILVQFNDTSRRISSLSGGEQTLFAISLMLTLQNLNPSPLCIFDEAQMFLDKSNTENVSKLIKDVTESGVQFIIITPNASTTLVNLADCVIGIAKNGPEEVSTVIQL